MDELPGWMADLDEGDLAFIKKFLLASGSLKEVAGLYGVSYPTVRLRLDRLIAKIRAADDREEDPYVRVVKQLALDEKFDLATAKILLEQYHRAKKEERHVV